MLRNTTNGAMKTTAAEATATARSRREYFESNASAKIGKKYSSEWILRFRQIPTDSPTTSGQKRKRVIVANSASATNRTRKGSGRDQNEYVRKCRSSAA